MNKSIKNINYIIIGFYILSFLIILFISFKIYFSPSIEGFRKRRGRRRRRGRRGRRGGSSKGCMSIIYELIMFTWGLSRGQGMPEYGFKKMYGKSAGTTPARSANPPTLGKLSNLRVWDKGMMYKDKDKCPDHRRWLAKLRIRRYAARYAKYKKKNM
jgi:hypothetical protein